MTRRPKSSAEGLALSAARRRSEVTDEKQTSLFNLIRGWPLLAQSGRSPHRSIRLADGCEGSHDCVDASLKLGDRERFLKKRKCDGVATLPRATQKAKRVEDRRSGVWN
jgi:hypothetical protein